MKSSVQEKCTLPWRAIFHGELSSLEYLFILYHQHINILRLRQLNFNAREFFENVDGHTIVHHVWTLERRYRGLDDLVACYCYVPKKSHETVGEQLGFKQVFIKCTVHIN